MKGKKDEWEEGTYGKSKWNMMKVVWTAALKGVEVNRQARGCQFSGKKNLRESKYLVENDVSRKVTELSVCSAFISF